MKLIDEATTNGARVFKACKEVGISTNTLARWRNKSADFRITAVRPEPTNKLSEDERQSIINIMNSPDFSNMTAVQVVVTLADRGVYIASESTFYRVLNDAKQNSHRGKSKKPNKIAIPETFAATGPNQVWTWDITWMDTNVKGKYYKLYTIIDIFSRKIVGWEIWEEENGELAAELMERTVLKENILNNPLVLHSDYNEKYTMTNNYVLC